MAKPTAINQSVHRSQRPIPRIVPARAPLQPPRRVPAATPSVPIDDVDDEATEFDEPTEIDPCPAGAAIVRVEQLRSRPPRSLPPRPLPSLRERSTTPESPIQPPRVSLPHVVFVQQAIVPLGRHYSYAEECEQRYLETHRVDPLPASAVYGRSFAQTLGHVASRVAAPLGGFVTLLIVVVVGIHVVQGGMNPAEASLVSITPARPAPAVKAPVTKAAEVAPVESIEIAAPAPEPEVATARPAEQPKASTKPTGKPPKVRPHAKRRPIAVDASTPLGVLRPS